MKDQLLRAIASDENADAIVQQLKGGQTLESIASQIAVTPSPGFREGASSRDIRSTSVQDGLRCGRGGEDVSDDKRVQDGIECRVANDQDGDFECRPISTTSRLPKTFRCKIKVLSGSSVSPNTDALLKSPRPSVSAFM